MRVFPDNKEDLIMSNDVLPFGFKKKMARIRSKPYEWFESPREDYEPLGVLEFKQRSDCGRSDTGASIAVCIAEAVTSLQGRYKMRTRTRKTAREVITKRDETIQVVQAFKADNDVPALEEHRRLCALQITYWARVWANPELPHAPTCNPDDDWEDASESDVMVRTGFSKGRSEARVRWGVRSAHVALRGKLELMDAHLRPYENAKQLLTQLVIPGVWEADDFEWVEDAGDFFEQAERLLNDFPDVFHKRVAAFATVNCGRYNDAFYRLSDGDFADANGTFLLTHEHLKDNSPEMYTPTGRPRKGLFRRFKNGDKLTFDTHVEADVHATLSEYIAWASNSAVETNMQLLAGSECLCVDLPLGIVTHVTAGMTEAFDDNAESTFNGPWYAVNGKFDADSMVSDTLSSAWKSVGIHRFQSGYDVHEYLVREYRHGYAAEEWTYFVYPEHVGIGEQLSLELQPQV